MYISDLNQFVLGFFNFYCGDNIMATDDYEYDEFEDDSEKDFDYDEDEDDDEWY